MVQAQAGDVLINESNAVLANVARGALWNGELTACLHQNHVFRVRCRLELLAPDYLASILALEYVRRYFRVVAKQTTIATVSSEGVRQLPVPYLTMSARNESSSRSNGL